MPQPEVIGHIDQQEAAEQTEQLATEQNPEQSSELVDMQEIDAELDATRTRYLQAQERFADSKLALDVLQAGRQVDVELDLSEYIENPEEIENLAARLSDIFNQEAGPIFDQLASRPEFSKIAEKRQKIIDALCIPVMNGHMSAEAILNIIQHIKIIGEGDLSKQSKKSAGYEGVFYYESGTNTLIISEKSLMDNFVTEGGQSLELDFEHLSNHELAHGVSEQMMSNENPQSLEKQLRDKNPQFSSEMLRQVRKIIDSAEEIKDSQSQHIRNVLEAVLKAGADYDEVSKNWTPEQKLQLSRENFILRRKAQAAIEIVTDYTALYLQSDGSFDNFVATCLNFTDKSALAKFLSKDFGGTSENFAENDQLSAKKLNEVIAGLKKGDKKLDFFVEKYPRLGLLFESYQVFYSHIGQFIKDNREQLELEDGDEFDWDEYYGSYDGYGGFEQNNGKAADSKSGTGILAAAGAFGKAFAEEVETVTKPMTGAPAGGQIAA